MDVVEVPGFVRPQISYGIFGWNTLTVPPAGKGELRSLCPISAPLRSGQATFRVTLARDVQSEVDLEVFLAGSGRSVGSVQQRGGQSLQILELPMPGWAVRLGATEGFGLRQWKGTESLWLFGPSTRGSGKVSGFAPHWLFTEEPGGWNEYLDRMAGADAFAFHAVPIGCLLDGLSALSRAFPKLNFSSTADAQMKGGLVEEGPLWPALKADVFPPYAYLARQRADFTTLPAFVTRAIQQHRHGDVLDEAGCVTALAMYSVASPLAIMAVRIKDADLLALALRQFRLRREKLWEGDVLWAVRYEDGRCEARNNSRAAAWYLLGLVKLLDALKDLSGLEDLIVEVRRVGKWALARQHSSGLWAASLDETARNFDTVASAGLAGALAIAARRGWLGSGTREAAAKTLAELSRHLTPDGYLAGAIQEEGLGGQSIGTDTCISQAGMGLLGLLLAEFPSVAEHR